MAFDGFTTIPADPKVSTKDAAASKFIFMIQFPRSWPRTDLRLKVVFDYAFDFAFWLAKANEDDPSFGRSIAPKEQTPNDDEWAMSTFTWTLRLMRYSAQRRAGRLQVSLYTRTDES